MLTWPTYGTWLPGPSHGWIEDCPADDFALPEPDQSMTAQRRQSGVKWPIVRLDSAQRQVVLADLQRIAAFRQFEVHRAIIAEDHAHVLLSTTLDDDAALHRLIQLIKGALSRALTVAAGGEPPRSAAGQALPHHKWWSRQYVWQRLKDQALFEQALELLARHENGAP